MECNCKDMDEHFISGCARRLEEHRRLFPPMPAPEAEPVQYVRQCNCRDMDEHFTGCRG